MKRMNSQQRFYKLNNEYNRLQTEYMRLQRQNEMLVNKANQIQVKIDYNMSQVNFALSSGQNVKKTNSNNIRSEQHTYKQILQQIEQNNRKMNTLQMRIYKKSNEIQMLAANMQ